MLLGNGDGTFQPAVNYNAGVQPVSVVAADLNGDGIPDLAVANECGTGNCNNGTVSILLGKGDGTFQVEPGLTVARAPISVVAGDFNHDGILDLATANNVGSNVSVLLGTGAGRFQAALSFEIGLEPEALTTGDLNGDGYPDLATANFGNSASALLNLPTPTASLSASTLSFGTQPVGIASKISAVRLTNAGDAELTISSIAVTSSFLESNTCGGSLEAGASCVLNIAFKPTSKGAVNGTVTITDNASDSPQAIKLSGTGTVVNLVPSTIGFGSVAIGQNASATVTMTNLARNAALTISSITAGSNPPFSQTNNCGTSLAPLATCNITVTFAPVATGTFGGSVTVTDNGGGTIQTVSLSGTGSTK